MANLIKYSTTSVSNTIKKGNMVLGINNIDYGPTSTSGFYNGITPPISGYTFYINKASGGPSIYVTTGDTQTIQLIQSLGGTGSTIENTLSWVTSQSDIIVVNKDYENIVTSGMVLNLDAGFTSSYPKGNLQWYDLSGSGNTGTLTNGPTFNSFSGGSIVFDGTNDYVSQTYTKLSNGLTLNAWMKTTSTRSVKSYLGDASNNIVGDTTNDVWIGFGVTNGKLNYNNAKKTGDWGTSQYYSNQSVNDGDWKSVTVTHSKTTELVSLYINSVLDSTYNNTSSGGFNQWAATAFNIIGGGAGAGDYFTGSLSNVQIYNRDLSPFEVYQNYNSMKGRFGIPDIVTSGLTLSLDAGNPYSYNPLNTASTLWVDTTYTTTGGTLTNGTNYSGGTMVFDGTNDYVSMNNFIGNLTTFSVSHFIYLNGTQNTRTIFSNYGVGNNGWVTGIRDDVNNIFKFYLGNTVHLYSNTVLSSTTWYHVSVTYNNGSPKIYINGVLDASSSQTLTPASSYYGNDIGRLGLGIQYFNGRIGDVEVYNRALSPSEVYQNFNALKNRYGFIDIVNEGLILNLDAKNPNSYNPLNTGSTTWTDVSGQGNNGTLINGVVYSAGTMIFDGINDYTDCGNIIRGRTTFSAEAWINTTDTRVGANASYHNPSIFGTQHGAGASGDFAMTLKSGYLGFYHELGGYGHIDTGIFVADGTWRHIAITKTTGGTITVYHNGTQVYTGSGYDSALRISDLQYYNWELGRAYWYGEDSSMLRYTGKIGSHKLYDRNLTSAEVLQNFNATRGQYGI
jgi:hypothetical protein